MTMCYRCDELAGLSLSQSLLRGECLDHQDLVSSLLVGSLRTCKRLPGSVR